MFSGYSLLVFWYYAWHCTLIFEILHFHKFLSKNLIKLCPVVHKIFCKKQGLLQQFKYVQILHTEQQQSMSFKCVIFFNVYL